MGRNKNNPPFFFELHDFPVSITKLKSFLLSLIGMKCSEFHDEDLPKFKAPVVTRSDEGCKECN
jgi:hypothetical protein